MSRYAFSQGKTSNVTRLHKGMYRDLRTRYHLPSQLACSVERQVAATYKGLWTKLKKNIEHRRASITKSGGQRSQSGTSAKICRVAVESSCNHKPPVSDRRSLTYPDCRPAFVSAFDTMQRVAVQGFPDPRLRLEAPFMHLTKQQIVQLGTRLGVPYTDTWSCYKGGEKHCGICGTCFERKEAFELAGIPDPTEYEVAGIRPGHFFP